MFIVTEYAALSGFCVCIGQANFRHFHFAIYFFQKFYFLHLKVLFVAKLYSSIEVIEKISYGDLQNMFIPFSLDKLNFLLKTVAIL